MDQRSAAARGFNHSPENLARLGQSASRSSAEGQQAALRRITDDIRRLDLERHVAELGLHGYTVIPPERVAPPAFFARVREAIFAAAERRSGIRPDLESGKGHDGFDAPFGQMLIYMLLEDPVFEQVLMNEVSVALVNYLLGERSLLSSSRAFLKPRGKAELGLHCDYNAPAPFPPYASMCNVTWALTDYSREHGGIAFVPGSHRFGRRPTGAEPMIEAVPVEAPAGSMIVFDGYTWHGAFARSSGGLRVAFANIFCRPYLFTLEQYGERVPAAVLARNAPRFHDFVGEYLGWQIDASGADMRKLGESAHASMGLY